MSRRAVKLDLTNPYHPYRTSDGGTGYARPTVDSLLRIRVKKAEAKKHKRLVIRLKREP